ncbi:tripartite tricarboxylate transporter TctB family protein [Coralliovum pocilloporae]|uniref:tripartite tricarboxylate transporter TctB family protein n=1 Tax=Coralliovum pocilloporae TaxID=3066369 RepID=UPI0033078583
MRKAELITCTILGILSLYLMWKSGEPPAWNPDVGRFANIGFIEGEGPGSGFWPFWLSLVMFLSCVWTGINWVRRTSPPSRSQQQYLDTYGKKMVVFVGGGIFGFLILIGFLGFYGAIPLFLIYYLKFLGRHSWLTTISIAVATPVVCFFFFDIAMRIVLPKGHLEPLFLPLYDIFY